MTFPNTGDAATFIENADTLALVLAAARDWLDLGPEDAFEARLAGTRLLALATAAYRSVPDALVIEATVNLSRPLALLRTDEARALFRELRAEGFRIVGISPRDRRRVTTLALVAALAVELGFIGATSRFRSPKARRLLSPPRQQAFGFWFERGRKRKLSTTTICPVTVRDGAFENRSNFTKSMMAKTRYAAH